MKPTQEILERIRDLAGLKRLEFGCAWKSRDDEWVYVEGFSITTNQKGGWTSVPPDESEIIGMPVQLNDLLRVIDEKLSKKGRGTEVLYFTSAGMIYLIDTEKNYEKQFNSHLFIEYKLALTVEQNLETNPDLRSLISNLIF